MLAAGRLASRWTILLNKSALSHGERLGGALCLLPAPPRSLSRPFPWMCPPLLSSPLLLLFCFVHNFPSLQILLSTCLLALRKRVLISSVTISCQLSLVDTEGGVKTDNVFYGHLFSSRNLGIERAEKKKNIKSTPQSRQKPNKWWQNHRKIELIVTACQPAAMKENGQNKGGFRQSAYKKMQKVIRSRD